MASSVSGGGDPFTGGAQQRNLAPPGVGGGIGSASTRVSNPAAGVAPTQIKSARPNEGSNIGIPYTRLVPLNNSNKLFLKNNQGKMEWRTETEDLRATCLAFILGVRGKYTGSNTANGIVDGSAVAPGYASHNVAYQPNIMPGMPGTERFQQLCSLEYLQMYFAQVLSNRTIRMGEDLVQVIRRLGSTEATTGPIGSLAAATAYADKAGIGEGQQGNPGLTGADNTMLNVQDIAKKGGLPGSEAQLAEPNYQGIFARDFGPFLKGKGSATQLVRCTVGGDQQTYGTDDDGNPVVAQPFSVSRNAGDDLAFAVLDAKLTEAGMTDWRPDGLVLSKGANDPSDKFSDEYLEARDGALYNIRVQGPAVGTNWTGERSLETLPLDKVFVVVVADVWWNCPPEVETAAKAENGRIPDPTDPTKTVAAPKSYAEYREAALDEELDVDDFKLKQAAAFMGAKENTVLCNFRVQVSTSSQMVNYSAFSKKGNFQKAVEGYKRPRLEGLSRMGLKLCPQFGEYVVGGWQIGQVLDTSASRAVMPQGQLMGVRTAPNTSALNINVQISWYTADRMARSFNNPEGTVATRFNAKQRALSENPVDLQKSETAWRAAAGEAAAEA